MNTSAIILMIGTQLVVTFVTFYLFKKVLQTPPRPEPDSFTENDED